jgi:hypothetical protein
MSLSLVVWVFKFIDHFTFCVETSNIFNYLALVYNLAIAVLKYFYLSGIKAWQFRAIYSNAHQLIKI